jgi:LysM repeat protein
MGRSRVFRPNDPLAGLEPLLLALVALPGCGRRKRRNFLPVAFLNLIWQALPGNKRMRWRLFFIVSLVVNMALAAAWFVYARHHGAGRGTAAGAGESLAPQVKTNVIVRRQFFSWAQVESADYPTYIANLRAIGCPVQTIRDIIIADVNALYAKRRATELVTPDQQWWRSQPDPEVVRAASEKLRALDEERRALLTRLLGPDWESGDLANLPRPSRPGVLLDGPVLGVLPADVKQEVQDVSARAAQRLQAYLDARRDQGLDPDPAELARLRQETRDELTNILTPPQLEEFLLRYSQDANNLRAQLGQLRYFNATPDEFRALFRATDSIDQRLALLAGSADPNSVAQRNSLMQQRDAAIKLALGADRYQQYQLLQDPAYQDAYASAQQAGDPEAAQTLYEINLATAQQEAAIRANTNLTAQQLAIELKRAELEQLKASAEALGQQVPPEPNPPPSPPSTYTHVIIPGETLALVSLLYNVTIPEIKAANPGIDFNQLKPGDSIQVPRTNIPLSPAAP